MENKKPQSMPAKPEQPKQSTSIKTEKPDPTKMAKPKQSAPIKKDQSATAKVEQPKHPPQVKLHQALPTKIAQPIPKKPNDTAKAERKKQPSLTQPQSPVAKAPANKASIDKVPVTKAPTNKAPIDKEPATKAPTFSKVDIKSNQSKPKIAPEPKPAPKESMKASEPKPVPKEPMKIPEQKNENKGVLTAVSLSQPSTFAKLATKGFVIQSWQIAVAVVVVLVLVVGGVLLGTVLGNKDMEDPVVDYTGPLTNNHPDDPSNIALPGYPSLVFPANSKKVTLELPNPSGNPCYFQYTLTIAETDEVLYQSELIEPGKMVKDLTINRALPAGTYTLRITIDTFSLTDSITPMNGGVQEVRLIVK